MITRILSLLALTTLTAQAHYLWIEAGDGGNARIYFGEFNEGMREKSGGRLDERDAIEGRLELASGTPQPLTFTKQADHFATTSPKKAGWLLVQDLTSEVKDWRGSDIGIVKPMFYARAALADTLISGKPSLTLDIVPDAKTPRELRVSFEQQPLANHKVMVYAPNRWMQELKTDEAGRVTIATPWPGQYVIEVIHKVREPGEFQGLAYEAVRHRATFTHIY